MATLKILHVSDLKAKPLPADLVDVEIRQAAWFPTSDGDHDFFVTVAVDPKKVNGKKLPQKITLISVLSDVGVDANTPPASLLAISPDVAPRVELATGGSPGLHVLALSGGLIPDHNERRFVTIGEF